MLTTELPSHPVLTDLQLDGSGVGELSAEDILERLERFTSGSRFAVRVVAQ